MSRLNYISVVSIVLLLIFLGGGYFIWLPKYQDFKYQKSVLAQFEDNFQKKEDYYSNLKNIQKTIESYQEEVNKINDSLPEEISLPVLFNFMSKVITENGLILDSISASSGENENSTQNVRRTNTAIDEPGSLINEEGGEMAAVGGAGEEIVNEIIPSLSLQKLTISLSLTGNYSNFKKFLQAIYRNAKIIEVKSISFSSPQESDLFSIDLSLETYFVKKAGDIASDGQSSEIEVENDI